MAVFFIKSTAVFWLVLAVWTCGSLLGLFNTYLLPPPWKVAAGAMKLAGDGTLLRHSLVSLARVLAGFAATVLIGLPLGIWVGLNHSTRTVLKAPLDFCRHIPPLALTPLLILWFGIGETSKLLVIMLAAFFPVFLNTVGGVANCDPRLIEVGQVLNLGRYGRIRRIILPAALPSIVVGLRLGLGFSWRSLIGAELLAAAAGLGYMIIEAEQFSRPDIVMVGIVVIGGLGLALDAVFGAATRRLLPWYRGTADGWH